MDANFRPTAVWRYLGRRDGVFALLLLAYLASGPLGIGSTARLLLLLLAIVSGAVAAVKWLHLGLRRAIWRLRNRLLVAYLFIALVPILLILTLAAGAGWVLTGQVAVHLADSELEQRVGVLEQVARLLARVPSTERAPAWSKALVATSSLFPRLDVVVEDRGKPRFPEKPVTEPPPEGWGHTSGVLVKDGELYLWAVAASAPVRATVLAPLTRRFLRSLVPGLGAVTILEFPETNPGSSTATVPMRLHSPIPGEAGPAGPALPPARNRLDYAFKRGMAIPVAIWDLPGQRTTGLLSIHSRLATVLGLIFRQQTRQGQTLVVVLLTLAVVFLLVELISLLVGISITRTMTTAFQDLYEGTEHVRRGDFSHRIKVRGNDQLAVINGSFNRMTGNLQRLLAVAKEKERMQAELEIARAVQRQLYPKSVPVLAHFELYAQCKPARMVSGDYYDYQELPGASVVVALGDVAGKGISAALLMATLQSSLRTHVRACLERGLKGNGEGREFLSTSRLVRQLNEQLYADTSPEKYATFYFAIYDDSSGALTYTNAGHLPPLLIRNGKITPLDVNGMVVGAFPFAEYGESRLQLESGDLLLAYTDGITEPENEYGEMFGEQRVMDVVLRHADHRAEEIVAAVMDAVEEWTGSPELQDDMTILVARRH